MPKEIHDKLVRTARRKFGSAQSERAKKYIYSTLNKIEKKKGK